MAERACTASSSISRAGPCGRDRCTPPGSSRAPSRAGPPRRRRASSAPRGPPKAAAAAARPRRRTCAPRPRKIGSTRSTSAPPRPRQKRRRRAVQQTRPRRLVWDDGVAAETCIDFDATHVSSGASPFAARRPRRPLARRRRAPVVVRGLRLLLHARDAHLLLQPKGLQQGGASPPRRLLPPGRPRRPPRPPFADAAHGPHRAHGPDEGRGVRRPRRRPTRPRGTAPVSS